VDSFRVGFNGAADIGPGPAARFKGVEGFSDGSFRRWEGMRFRREIKVRAEALDTGS